MSMNIRPKDRFARLVNPAQYAAASHGRMLEISAATAIAWLLEDREVFVLTESGWVPAEIAGVHIFRS